MLFTDVTLFDQEFFKRALGLDGGQDFTVRYFLTDSRTVTDPGISCFLGIKGGHFNGSDYALQAYEQGVRVFVLDKKITLPKDAVVFWVEDGIKALAQLASSQRERLLIPHVLITGSVGKTTTRLIFSAILRTKYPVHTARKNFNNEIGLPLTLLETPQEAKASVLEAGMNSRGEIARLSQVVRPEIALITNVHLIHAGPLGGLGSIAEAKGEITEGMGAYSLLLLNEEDPFKEQLAAKAKGKTAFFRPSDVLIEKNLGEKGFWFRHKSCPEISFHCPLAGGHLALNLAAAFALAEIFHVPPLLIQKGLAQLSSAPERMNFLHPDKALVIADCYNASLPSFKAALDVLKNSPLPRRAVMGDILELGDFTQEVHLQLARYAQEQLCADEFWIFGSEMQRAFQEIAAPCRIFESLENLKAEMEALYKEGGSFLVKASHGMGFSALLPKE